MEIGVRQGVVQGQGCARDDGKMVGGWRAIFNYETLNSGLL
jgi:hypothetical protein